MTADDVRDAARLALPHRRRKDPLDPPGTDEERLDEALAEAERRAGRRRGPAGGRRRRRADPTATRRTARTAVARTAIPTAGGPDGRARTAGGRGPGGPATADRAATRAGPARPAVTPDRPDTPAGAAGADADGPTPGAGPAAAAGRSGRRAGPAYRPRTLAIARRGEGGHAGRRSPAFARRGRVVGSRGAARQARRRPAPARHACAAALHRGAAPGRVQPRDLREAVHVGREANLVLFVVDASGSMAARKRMTVVKTAVLSLLRDAYQRRDRIGMITFRGHDAEQVLAPTSSHEVGVLRLASLRTGGRTPLAAGLRAAAATIATERRRDPRRRPLLVVVTDGRATSGPDPVSVAPALAGVAAVVVDCESGPVRLGLARRLAAALDADLMPLERSAGHRRRESPRAAMRLASRRGR